MVAYRAVGAAGLAPHAMTNAGQEASHHFVVELLGPSTAGSPKPPEHNNRGRTEFPSPRSNQQPHGDQQPHAPARTSKREIQ